MTEQEWRVLAVEAQTWRFQGAKAEHIYVNLGMSEARYTQILNRLLDSPEALAAYPVMVNRLRRLRAQRMTHRALP